MSLRSVNFIIYQLRHRVPPLANLIESVYGRGYQLNTHKQIKGLSGIPLLPLLWQSTLKRIGDMSFRSIVMIVAASLTVLTAIGITVVGTVPWAIFLPFNDDMNPLASVELIQSAISMPEASPALIDPQLAVIVQGISGIALLHDDQYLLVRDGRGAMADANVLLQLRLVLGDITHGRRTLQPMFQSQHRLQNMSGSVLMPAVAGQLTPLHPPLTPMDAEGLAVSRHGTVWIADEASATLRAFDQSGQETRVIHLPAVYDVPMNSQLPGRTRWRGLCGVSLTPDERYLFTTTKSPTPADGGSQGIWLRVLRIDLKTGKTVQYPLALEAPVCLVSDLLALDSQKLLVLEYDLQVLDGFQRARVTQVNLTGADDVSHVDALPLSEHPQWFSGVGKQVRIDLNHDFPTRRNLPRPMFQAMCLGPLDSRGHPTLLLASDNLAQAGYPTVFALYPLPQ